MFIVTVKSLIYGIMKIMESLPSTNSNSSPYFLILYILFCEHDTPLGGDINFSGLVDVLGDWRDLNLIRLHHEATILDCHRHLMIYPQVRISEYTFVRTVQWSQRPHLARADFYRNILRSWFRSGCRTMIEDLMHGRVRVQWEGAKEWKDYGLAIFAPPGNMQRSWHYDARGDEPKYENVF